MNKSSMTPKGIVHQLSTPHARAESVLVLGGTGTSMWTYYPILKAFSLAELSEFSGIFGISGGAASLWYYVLRLMGLFKDSDIANYEPAIRTLNNGTIFHRLWKLGANSYIYDTQQLADGIETFAGASARNLLFSEFPLKNFTAVGHDHINDTLILLSSKSTPSLCMGDAMASLSAPQVIAGRRLFRPMSFDGFGITDFDFSGLDLRWEFKNLLMAQGKKIYWLNIFFSAQKPEITYIKCSKDSWPKIGQIFDLLMLFAGLPNGRIYAASK